MTFAKVKRSLKKFIPIFLPFVLLVSACSLDSKKDFKISAEFKEYFQFKSGSWIYKLEGDTNQVDTCKIVSWEEGKMAWDAFNQEFFKYEVQGSKEQDIQIRAVADDNKIDRVSILVKIPIGMEMLCFIT